MRMRRGRLSPHDRVAARALEHLLAAAVYAFPDRIRVTKLGGDGDALGVMHDERAGHRVA